MDIVRFKGGLGNQMFQYAFMESLRSRGREVYASLGWYGEKIDSGERPFLLDKIFKRLELPIIDECVFDEINSKWRKIKNDPRLFAEHIKRENIVNRFFSTDSENDSYAYIPYLYEMKNCVYVGYWQSAEYFKDLNGLLLEKFEFSIPKCVDQPKMLGEMIAVHVRRGDYLLEDSRMVCSQEWYESAIDVVRKRVGKVKFLFFSDDIDWVKEKFIGKDYEYYDRREKDWLSMYYMSKCRGNIIANSSFSWWSAYLNTNSEIVVSPKYWIKESSINRERCGPFLKSEKWILL